MFIEALFLCVKAWKEPRYPAVGEWINKLWYTQTTEQYSALKRNELSSHEKIWCVLVTQSYLTLCDPIYCSLQCSSLQARILEWVAIRFSRGSSRPRDRTQISCIAGRFFTTAPPGKPWVPSLVPNTSLSLFEYSLSLLCMRAKSLPA